MASVMRFLRELARPWLALTSILVSSIALAACGAPPQPSQSSTAAPGQPGAQPPADPAPVALGVTVDARDERGAPRLIRAVAPRPGLAGAAPEQAARDHVAALAPLWVQDRPAADLASAGVQRLRNGGAIVRLQQQIDQVVVHHGELRVMTYPDGSLAAIAGTLRPRTGSAAFHASPAAALDRALDAMFGAARARPAITAGAERAGHVELAVAPVPGLAVHAARARRELLPDGDQLIPIWSVEVIADATGVDGGTEPVTHRVLIADADGSAIRDLDLTDHDSFVYRVFAETTGERRPLDGALDSFTPHPTGVPDGSLPGPAPYNLVVMEAFNGPRDPWLGPAATTTSGNNVNAFAQPSPTGDPAADIHPEIRSGRILNYVYDFTAEPLATPTQSKAAAVNAFFVTNWLHDWYYDSGFTEATGNAQADNFGRGGVGGDPLIVHAQEAALDASRRNNSSMTTPADGLSPTMHMLLWSGAVSSSLTTPDAALPTGTFTAGPRNFDVTGTAVLASDAATGTLHDACAPVSGAVAGKIAVFEFGPCANAIAIANLQAAGAIAVIESTPFATPVTLPGNPVVSLPGLVLDAADGSALEAALPVTATLHRATTIEHDGDLDNALVAHEWGHSLHRRLTSCEIQQCNAMSEGWADFVALHMMLRDTDDRTGSYGVALYALTAGGWTQLGNADPGYFGIRRFPYSIDRTRNALGFRHIATGAALPDTPINPSPVRNGNAEVHNAGEVWTTMLWEAYNTLLDAHPFGEARRRMSDYVVAGMLLTPPNATYTEARDAILAAAGALDRDDALLMAAAFAGRGAGSCAVSPLRTSNDFIGVVESGTLAARLETSALDVTDDGVSCDHDGYLDPGETGTLRVTIANTGAVAAEDVVVTATTAAPGVTLGRPIHLGNLAPVSQVDLAIPVSVAASAPAGARLDIALAVDGDAGCNTRHVVVGVQRPLGVDEAAATATRDGFETQQLAWTPTGDGTHPWRRAADGVNNHVLFGADAPVVADTQIVSPVLQVSPTEPFVVTLSHAYDLNALTPLPIGRSAGVIELSSDAGATWRDVTALGVDPGYNVTVLRGTSNPLAGRRAFSGKNPSSPARDPLTLDFGTQLAGQAVQLRFRVGSGTCCASAGWQLDDIAVTGITNAPFPSFVPEPAVCTARAVAGTAATEPAITARRALPRASLDGVGLPAAP
jgi:hypothetical protein